MEQASAGAGACEAGIGGVAVDMNLSIVRPSFDRQGAHPTVCCSTVWGSHYGCFYRQPPHYDKELLLASDLAHSTGTIWTVDAQILPHADT